MPTIHDLDDDQLAAIEFGLDGEDALFCADVGTGKTVIALMIAAASLANEDVKRWLVLAPLLVAADTWANEPDQWDQLSGLKLAVACGDERQRIKALESDAEIVVMNYENLRWLMDRYPRRGPGKDTLPFDGLICDEIDKLKSVHADRFKSFRNRLDVFKKRIGLTGTFMPNKLTDIWGQAYVVDGGQTFGRSFYEWRKKNFYPTDFQQRNWAPFEHTRQKVIDQLADLVFRLKAKNMPEVIFDRPTVLKLPDEIRKRYDKLEANYFLQVDGKEIDVANAGVLVGALQQITAGFSYTYPDLEKKQREIVWHDKRRFDWLDHTLARFPEQFLIFYHFTEELEELLRRYPGMPYLGGGVSTTQKVANIKRWNLGSIDKMALHPASAGHGLNLQHSGAHHIAFLTLPWSGGMFKQVVGRLARRGQRAPLIHVHSAIYEHTIDQTVYDVLSGRLEGMERFLDDLEKAIAA